MTRYISNKKVNPSKSNNLSDFDGIGDSIWNFISSVYQTNWDSFYTDNKATTLRVKISSKFTLRIAPNTNKSNKDTTKHVLVTIEKVLLSLSLLAKSKKEANVISKYFQNNKPLVKPKKPAITYAQALKPTANMSKVLKSRKHSLPSMRKKLTKLVTSSKAI